MAQKIHNYLLFLILTLSMGEIRCQNIVLLGNGATFPSPVYAQWNYIYKATKPAITLSYQATGSGAGRKAIFANAVGNANNVDYAGSDSVMPDSEYNANPTKDLIMFPFVAGSTVMVYNLPILNTTNNEKLVLTRDVLFQIFTAQITFWNDSRIVNIQNNTFVSNKLMNYAKPIIPVVRSDASGTTEMFVKSLRSFNGGVWNRGSQSNDTWPDYVLNRTSPYDNFVKGSGNLQILGVIFSQEGTIGYVSYALIVSQGANTFASIINKGGKTPTPDGKYVAKAMDAVVFNDRFNADLVDSDDPDAYPIAGFSYVVIERAQQPYHVCSKRRELFKYFEWVVTADITKESAEFLGFAGISAKVSSRIQTTLRNFTCDGVSLLEYETITKSDVSLAIWIVNSIILAAGVAVAIAFVVMNMSSKSEARAFVLYGGVLGLGTLFMKVSVYFWAVVPVNTSICMARIWFLCLGYTIVLSANFSRASMIKWIQKLVKSDDWGQEPPTFYLELFRDIGILTIVQVIILLIWSLAQPYSSLFVITDTLNFVGEWRCETEFWGYYIIELAFLGVCALYGILVIYRAWNLTTQANQVKWILITTYNYVLIFLVFAPLFYFQKDEKNRAILACVGILFLALQSEICFFVPSFLYDAVRSFTTASSNSKKDITSKELEPYQPQSEPAPVYRHGIDKKQLEVYDAEKTEDSEDGNTGKRSTKREDTNNNKKKEDDKGAKKMEKVGKKSESTEESSDDVASDKTEDS